MLCHSTIPLCIEFAIGSFHIMEYYDTAVFAELPSIPVNPRRYARIVAMYPELLKESRAQFNMSEASFFPALFLYQKSEHFFDYASQCPS